MRSARTSSIAVLLAATLAASAAAQRPASLQPVMNRAVAVAVGASAGPVGYDFFYRNLAPHGYWAQRPNYGWVWMPHGVAAGWRPYTAGRWAYSDAGWTWVSAESWGWATYHYGRWYEDPQYGWSWVPGTEWAPSWVSWQEGGNYLGWAPLPPAVGWNASVGLDLGGFNLSAGIAPSAYCFVPEQSFLALNIGAFILPVGRNAEIFRNTTNFTNYGLVNGRVFNRGLAVDRVQQFTGHPVPRYNLATASGGPRGDRLSGNSIAVFRPAEVVRRENGPDPAHLVPHAVATAAFLAGREQAHRADAVAHGGAEGRLAPSRENRGAVASRSQAPHQTVARHNAAHSANAAHRTPSSPRANSVHGVHRGTPASAAHTVHHSASGRQVAAHTRRPPQHQATARHGQPAGRSTIASRSPSHTVRHSTPQPAVTRHQSSPPPQRHAAEERAAVHQSSPPAQRSAPAAQAHHAPPPPPQRSRPQAHQAPPRPPAEHAQNEHEHGGGLDS
jgi:hypothetical protein